MLEEVGACARYNRVARSTNNGCVASEIDSYCVRERLKADGFEMREGRRNRVASCAIARRSNSTATHQSINQSPAGPNRVSTPTISNLCQQTRAASNARTLLTHRSLAPTRQDRGIISQTKTVVARVSQEWTNASSRGPRLRAPGRYQSRGDTRRRSRRSRLAMFES